MTGLTTDASTAVLNWVTGKLTAPALTNSQVGLFSTLGSGDGFGFTELTGLSYARVQTQPSYWGAPTGIDPVQITNTRTIAFPVSASNWGTVLGFGLFDGNNALLYFDYLGTYQWTPFTCGTGTNAVFNSPSHGLVVGDQIVLSGEFGGLLPQATTSLGGILTIASVTTDTFTANVNVTVSGNGMLRKVLPLTIGLNQTATFNPAALVLQLA